MALWILRIILTMIVLTGADAQAQPVSFERSTLDVVTADSRRHSFAVELAATPDQLSQGLMFRKSLAADAGMLFNFGTPRQVSMWMKNTLIPLDMLFMDRGGRIIRVEEYAVPGSLEPRGPPESVLAVLELSAGTARRLGIRSGDRVEHAIFNARR